MGTEVLSDTLLVHKTNLEQLKLQAAEHGSPVPLSLLNAIAREERAIRELQLDIDLKEQEAHERQNVTWRSDDMTEPRMSRVEAKLDDIVTNQSDLKTMYAVLTQQVNMLNQKVDKLEAKIEIVSQKPKDNIPAWLIPSGSLIVFLVSVITFFILVFAQ